MMRTDTARQTRQQARLPKATMAAVRLLLGSGLAIIVSLGMSDPARSQTDRETDPSLAGRGEREIVLIHGLGSSREVWNEVTPFLRGSYKVWTYELPGHGTTPPIANAAIATVAEDLGRYLQENDIAYPVLVGHAMGALIAMRYTFDHPAEVRRLIVIDAGPKQLATPDQKIQVTDAIMEDYDRFVAGYYLSMSPDSAVTDLIVDQALKTDSVTFTTLLLSSFDFDVTEELSRQAVPILVIGSHMFFRDPENAVAHLDAIGYANARTISFKHVAYTGHFIMLERPTYLASIILAYCVSGPER